VKRLLQTIMLVTCAMPLAGSAALDIRQPPAPTVEIQSVPLRQKQVSDGVTGLGAVAASDEATTDISFLHAGEVTSLDVQTGERVRKGQRLAELTADPAAVQNFDRAVAALNFAKQDLERMRTLLAQHLATNAQVATAQKAYDDAVAAVATERKIGDDKPTELAAAPFDGFVVKLMVALGDRIQQNTPLMKLARTDVGARIVVGLPADQASRVSPGMDATITAIMNANPQQMTAKVGGVSDSVNPASRLIDCWLTLSHATDRIAEGSTVNVTIVVAQHRGWVAPRQSVLKDDKGAYIFQLDGAIARRVEVQTGIETDDETEVSGVFDPTKQVVTQGNYELQDGMKVRGPAPAPSK
jgi:membrane fusion protein (multidrug efflux system)